MGDIYDEQARELLDRIGRLASRRRTATPVLKDIAAVIRETARQTAREIADALDAKAKELMALGRKQSDIHVGFKGAALSNSASEIRAKYGLEPEAGRGE